MNENSKDWCVLSLQRFPKELKKKLKMKALEKDVDLQELCARYLEAGLANESKPPTGSSKR